MLPSLRIERNVSGGAPRRRVTDHVHPDYWTEADQHRFEDRIANELKGIREDLEKVTTRVLIMFGGLILLAFLLTFIAPFVRDWLRLPAT